MAPPIAIQTAAWHLPDRTIEVAGLPELGALAPDAHQTCLSLGIDEVRADDGLSAFDLAAHAAHRALADAGLHPADLDVLIMVDPRAPQTLVSSPVTRLQALLGAHRAVTFSIGGLGCASIGPALLTARGLLAADPDLDNILVVHGSKPAAPGRYRHPVTVNGDSGQAVLLGRRGPVRVLDILQETNGEYWDLFQVDYADRPQAQWREECRDVPTYSFQLAVETRNRLTALSRRILQRNGMRHDDVCCYVSQNLSAGAFQFVEESLGVKLATACRDNLRRYGHLGPNDVLLNLYTEIEQGRLPDQRRALLLNVSPVAAWSLLLVETGDGNGTPQALCL